jgi:hypothetical protein
LIRRLYISCFVHNLSLTLKYRLALQLLLLLLSLQHHQRRVLTSFNMAVIAALGLAVGAPLPLDCVVLIDNQKRVSTQSFSCVQAITQMLVKNRYALHPRKLIASCTVLITTDCAVPLSTYYNTKSTTELDAHAWYKSTSFVP